LNIAQFKKEVKPDSSPVLKYGVFSGRFIIAVLFIALIIVPLVRNDIGLARNPQNYMSLGWQEATQYLRSQLSTEQEAEYYKIYQKGEEPDVSYVLTWWDYGYWIARDAHMPVICTPSGGQRMLAAKLLLNKNPDETVKRLKELNIKYVVIDSQTAVEKFYAVVQLAGIDLKGLDLDKYYDVQGGELFKTSDYYKTFLVQLYFFDAKRINNVKLVYVSDSKVMIEDGYIPEVKVFEVQ